MKILKHILFCITFLLLSISIASSQTDSSKVVENKSTYVMSKSPSGAIYRSLALPGWGQLYVESYWKAPIFFAATGTLIYFIIDNQIKYNDYDKRLLGMSKTDIDYQITKIYREYYRDNRDMSGFYLIGVYVLAAVDAYVGAHLYDFQVDDKLSMYMGVSATPIPMVNLQIKF